jgi:hypothetical protein
LPVRQPIANLYLSDPTGECCGVRTDIAVVCDHGGMEASPNSARPMVESSEVE